MSFTRSLLFILLLLIGLSTSCHDKTPTQTQCTNCQSVLAAKEFFLFKPGSWWVYEEEHSHVRDSMYVYSYANGTDYQFDIVIKSALDQYEYNYWPVYNGQPTDHFCSKTSPVAKECLYIKISKFIPGSQQVAMEATSLMFQYREDDSIQSYNFYYPNNLITIKEIMNQSDFGFGTFNQTVKVHNPHNRIDQDHPTNYYYSKGVGIIRKELLDTSEVWNLVNYHIEE